MIKLKNIYFKISGKPDPKRDSTIHLCYTSSAQHAIKVYLNEGWTIDQLQITPLYKI